MIINCFLYTVVSKVIFKDGSRDAIPIQVYTKSEFTAMLMARDYLESGKSGFKIKEVTGQYLSQSSNFLMDDRDKVISFDEMFPS